MRMMCYFTKFTYRFRYNMKNNDRFNVTTATVFMIWQPTLSVHRSYLTFVASDEIITIRLRSFIEVGRLPNDCCVNGRSHL